MSHRNVILLFFVIVFTGCATTQKSVIPEEPVIKWSAEKAKAEIKTNDARLALENSQQLSDFIYQDYFLKGNSAYLENEFEIGNVYFSKLSEVYPEDLYIKQKFAVGLIRSGDFNEAKKHLISIFTAEPKKYIKVGLVLGGVHAGLGENEEAKSIYRRVLAIDPTEHDACLFLAKSYLGDKDSKTAIKTLQNCGKKNPSVAMYPFYLGKIYLTMDDEVRAEELFKKAYDIDDSYSEALNSYATILEKNKKIKKSINLLRDHLVKYENDHLILSTLVERLFYYERFLEVLPYAEKLSDLNPDDLNLKVKLGILYSDAKKYDLAISTFNEILVQIPDSDKVLYYLAAIYQEVDELDKSVETYTKIKSDSSLYQESIFQVATILERFALEELKEDKENKQGNEFISFVEKNFDDQKDLQVRFAIQLAGYYEAQKDYAKATTWIKKVLIHEKMTQNHKFYYASLLEKQQKFGEAYNVVNEILLQEPKNAHALNFLGYSLLEREIEQDKAHQYISSAMKISPTDGYILDSMGWYHFKKGDFSKAYSYLQKAFEQVPADPTIAKHLVLSYMKLHNEKKVEKFLSQLFDKSPGLFEVPEFVEVLKEHSLKERFPASDQ